MRPRKSFNLVAAAIFFSVSSLLGQSPATSSGRDQSMPCMEGMVMPGCTSTAKQPPNPVQESPDAMQMVIPATELLKEVVGRPAMSLADFLKLGDAENPTLKQAKQQVQRTQQQARQAALYPNPSVGYQGDQIRGGSYGGGQQGGFIQQTIVLGGKLGARRNIFQQQQRSAEIGVDEQSFRVHGDIERAFYDALTAQETVHLQRQLLGIALEAVQTVHQLANVGQADEPDILQTEVEAEQAKVNDTKAQRSYLQAFTILAAVSGKPNLSVSPLEGDLEKTPELNAAQMVDAIVADSPTVKRAEQEVEVAEARWKDAKREIVPDLQLRAGEQYNGQQLSSTSTKPAGAQSFASASINIPLWNRNQGNVGAASVDIERARQDVLREQLALRQQAAPLAQSFESARFEADRYKAELLPRASKAYRLYLKKYQEMAQAYPQVLVSQRTYFQLKMGYLMALQDVWRSAVALQNFTLSGALGRTSTSGPAMTSLSPSSSGEGQE